MMMRKLSIRSSHAHLTTRPLPPLTLTHRRTLLEIASQYSSVSPDGSYAPQSMIAAAEDLLPATAVATGGRGHGRALLGGVYPEGDLPSDIVVTENNHGGGGGALPHLLSKRRLAQAGLEGGEGVLSEVGSPFVCGDGICSGEQGGGPSLLRAGWPYGRTATMFISHSLVVCRSQ